GFRTPVRSTLRPGLIRHWQAKQKLRPRGALAPRNLFIGSNDPFAQIILNNSMISAVSVVPVVRDATPFPQRLSVANPVKPIRRKFHRVNDFPRFWPAFGRKWYHASGLRRCELTGSPAPLAE